MTPEILGRALAEAPDPELARLTVSRIGERPAARNLLGRPDIMVAAARLLGFSSAASDFFLAHPEELESLADPHLRAAGDLDREAAADVAAFGPVAGLRRFRRRASYRIAARDLAGAPVEEVMEELSAMADACLAIARGETPGADELAIVALGKLGGRELNYASDVDVVFLHRSTGPAAQEAASKAAARVVALLSETSAGGVALRVDTALRPEGRSGPPSRSLESAIEDYERHAALDRKSPRPNSRHAN